MRKKNLIYLLLFGLALESCCFPYGDCYDEGEEFTSMYEPVYLDRTAFEASVLLKNSLAIGISGKIYVKGDLLFINELRKGFHVYDNSDPANPKAIKFIEAPGSTDMAIRDNIIYINQATDLIAVSYGLSSNTATVTKRVPNTFPALRSPDGYDAYDIPENSVLIDWKLKN